MSLMTVKHGMTTAMSTDMMSMIDMRQMTDVSIMQGLHDLLHGMILLTQVLLTLRVIGGCPTDLTTPKTLGIGKMIVNSIVYVIAVLLVHPDDGTGRAVLPSDLQ